MQSKYVLIAIGSGLIAFLLFVWWNQRTLKQELIAMECRGIITEIRQSPNHGIYEFLINDKWEYFATHGEFIHRTALKGDSLVKEQGKQEVTIFRRSSDNEFQPYVTFTLSVPQEVKYWERK